MEFTIATLSDIGQLVEMRILYIFEYFAEVTNAQEQQIRRQLPAYFKKHMGQDMTAFIAKEQDKIIATVILIKIEKPANPKFVTGVIGEVLSVYTCKDYRRQGIAKHLMEMLLSYSKEQGFDFVELKASEDGYPLYKSVGFDEERISYALMKYII